MPNEKTSNLPTAGTLDGSEVVPVLQGGANKRTNLTAMLAFVLGVAMSAVFGDGSDGNLTPSSGTTTLTRDTYYNDVTLSGTARIRTNGWRMFVKGTLTIGAGCSVDARGNPGGTGAAGPSGQNDGGATITSRIVSGSAAGGRGGYSGGSSGANGTNVTNSVGGKGGAGGAGAGTGSAAGGTGGTVGAPAYQPNFSYPECLLASFFNSTPNAPTAILGGSGGAGGGYGGTYFNPNPYPAGGGGGGGGGVLVLVARIIVNNGSIDADGGAGGAGTGNGVDLKYGGGGGGGGGGYAVVIYRSLTGNAPTANGGAGGAAGGGAAVAGTAGGAGKVLAMQM